MIRVMKVLFSGVLCMALLLPPAAQAKVQMLDRIVAVVNDGVIMNSELEQRVDQIVAQFNASKRPLPPIPIIRKQILERMIIERLQLQLANRMGIRVDDNALNQTLTGIAKQNGMDSLQQFSEQVRADGQNWEELREHIRDEMIISEVQHREVSQQVHITDREVKRFMSSEVGRKMFQADFHLGQIMIKVPSDASPQQVEQAKAKADALVKQLRNGADFSQLAVANSSGPKALEGGDLGWRPAAQWPTLFANAAIDMKKGQISDPLRSGAGFHILKMIDRRGGDQKVVTQYQVRHILIKPDQLTTSQQALAEANKLHDEVASGKLSFADAAKQYSADPGSASQGGELGWVSPGQMVSKFEEAMEHTPPGTLSPVFETRYGYHFLEVEKTRRADMSDQYREMQARNALKKQRYDEALETWLQKLRSEAYVDIRLDNDNISSSNHGSNNPGNNGASHADHS